MSKIIDFFKITIGSCKLMHIYAYLCKCDFLFPEEIKTIKNLYQLLDIGFPSKFNIFLNVTTPLDLPSYRIVDLV